MGLRQRVNLFAVLVLGSILAACGSAPVAGPSSATTPAAPAATTAAPATDVAPATEATAAPAASAPADSVSLQLKWVAQAQFAGYYLSFAQSSGRMLPEGA